jgi:hypothetical protein
MNYAVSEAQARQGALKTDSPLEEIPRAAEAVRDLEARVEQLAVRLIGDWRGPEAANAVTGVPVAGQPLIDLLGSTGAAIRVRAERMVDAINAIERKLP